MDPITTAIIAALANLSQDAIKDSYNALKGACKKKFGETSDLVEAVEKLEEKPDSQGRQRTLQEEIEAVNGHQETEIIQLAQALLDKIQEQSPTKKNTTIGTVTATGKGGTATGIVEAKQVGHIGGIQAKK